MFEAVAEFLVYVVLVGTGRVAVAVLSLGRWRGASMSDKAESIHGAAGALSFVRHGQRVVTTTGLGLAGGLFYVVAAVGLLVGVGASS